MRAYLLLSWIAVRVFRHCGPREQRVNRVLPTKQPCDLHRMRITNIVVLIVATLAVDLRTAHADDQDYGEQIVLADVASMGVLYTATRLAKRTESDQDSKLVIGAGLGGYLLFAPAVHLIGHGREDRAALSIGMRLVPTAALLSIDRCDGGEEALGCILGHLLLATVGALAVSAVDAFVVADGESATMPVMLGVRF